MRPVPEGDVDATRTAEDEDRFVVPEGSPCGCCSGGWHAPDEGGGEGGGAPQAGRDLPSLDWDDAAGQLGRSGRSWGGVASSQAENGQGSSGGVRVTYGFLADGDVSSDGGRSYRAFDDAEIAMVEYAMRIISEAANIEFACVSGADGVFLDDPIDAQIDLDAMVDTNAGVARTTWSGNLYHSATVSIGERGLEDLGSYAFRTALHEIMHAVGVSHPGDYDGRATYGADAEYEEDSGQYTVMSYFDETMTGADYGRSYSTNLMLHDIAALQAIYGANEATRTGDTVYGFGSTTDDAGWSLDSASDAIIAAIWDAGGRDVLDLSGYAADQRIDLRAEAFSDVGGLTGNLSIARGVVIEDAVGGAGDDVLTGNDASNVLAGGAGADHLIGGVGDDVLYGDSGLAGWDVGAG